MKPAIGYIRVSTTGQAQEGVSLDAQQARIEQWASQHGYELVEVCRDNGISGGKLDNRPGAQRAIALACEHHAALVVYSLSRLARSTKDALAICGTLKKGGANLVSLTEQFDTTTAAGEMFFTLLAAFAQFERSLVSERTRTALQHMQANGRKISSNAPYGYRHAEGAVIPDEKEKSILERIKALADAGKSYWMIAKELNSAHIPARCGKPWKPDVIRQILARLKQAPAIGPASSPPDPAARPY